MVPALVMTLLLTAASASDGRLVGQQISGMSRICRYQNPDILRRRMTPEVRRRIGIGEPCPAYYVLEQVPRPVVVPSMATLQGTRRENGQLVCTYEYLGRYYARVLLSGTICPLTPHF